MLASSKSQYIAVWKNMMSKTRFRDTVDLLAKSSPEAVTTLRSKPSSGRELKEYLYVQTDIERDLRQLLDDSSDPKRIVFLCGSSGDGKSEILCRVFNQYQDVFEFHLDATHSFSPDKDAIETLNNCFHRHKVSNRPLVMGINIGMLGNYLAGGSEEHDDIKKSIDAFLQENHSSAHHIFLNFEDYPKFRLDDNKAQSPFISALLDKITAESEQNPLYRAFSVETSDDYLYANYCLLQFPEVKDSLARFAHFQSGS
jgi:DNA phosphorothioation-dependent restriction protein DptF